MANSRVGLGLGWVIRVASQNGWVKKGNFKWVENELGRVDPYFHIKKKKKNQINANFLERMNQIK